MNVTLSERERTIIILKAKGKTVREIARQITKSRAYTEQLIHDLFHKTGSVNSASLVDWGYQNYILELNRGNLPIKEEERA